MIVIRMAMTPSLNASRRPLPTVFSSTSELEFYRRTRSDLGHNQQPRRMQREAEPGTAVAHEHGLGQTPEGRIRAALILTLLTMGASIAGGIFAHSLALLSDAGHMLADAGALALALVAQRVASRPRTHRRTYGSRRAETLAAFTNAIFLGVVSVWVIAEALERWREPPDIKGGWMLGVAAGGLVVNLAAARLLAGGVHNENTRAALAHVLSDAAGSVAAMIAALLVLGWGWRRADPLISVGLA